MYSITTPRAATGTLYLYTGEIQIECTSFKYKTLLKYISQIIEHKKEEKLYSYYLNIKLRRSRDCFFRALSFIWLL